MKLVLLTFLISVTLPAYAEWKGQGEVSFEGRVFESQQNTSKEDRGLSLFSRVQTQYEKERYGAFLRMQGRAAEYDQDRTFITVEDAYLKAYLNANYTVQLRAGYQLFNWTALEAFHPADMINSRNYDSNIEKLEKLGELATTLDYTTASGANFKLFYMPRTENPLYPGSRSRLGYGVDLAKPHWVDDGDVSSDDQWHHQYGLRGSHTIGPADMAVFAVRHYDRENPIIGTHIYTTQTFSGQTYYTPDSQLRPYYFETMDYGMSASLAWDNFVFKFEGLYRDFQDEDIDILLSTRFDQTTPTVATFSSPTDYAIVSTGAEWNWTHAFGADSFFYLEYQRVLDATRSKRAGLNIFQNDLFLGHRLQFNDAMSKEIFWGVFVDLERSQERLFTAYYKQRLSNSWSVETGVRIYDAPVKDSYTTGLELLNDADHVYLTLSRFF